MVVPSVSLCSRGFRHWTGALPSALSRRAALSPGRAGSARPAPSLLRLSARFALSLLAGGYGAAGQISRPVTDIIGRRSCSRKAAECRMASRVVGPAASYPSCTC